MSSLITLIGIEKGLMQIPIYLDYAATTPVDPEVAKAMCACLTQDGNFGNPASRSHIYGWRAEEAVETARDNVAQLLNADPREIVWTSGATESNNLAIKGLSQAKAQTGRHIVTSRIEHKAVLDPCHMLEQQGFEVTYLQPNRDGLIEPEQVAAALRPDTILVSLMHVNNELGVRTDIRKIGEMCRARAVVFHVDAAQSAGKEPLDVKSMCVDLLSISGHKMYGPKGVGALYVRRGDDIRLFPQIHGGGHERGMRSGTLATHQVVGLGEAARIAGAKRENEQERIMALKQRFWQGIQAVGEVAVNGSLQHSCASILNLRFGGTDGENLMMALRELAVSSGSACTSASLAPSYVLTAIGISDLMAHSSLRFSFGRFTTAEEIDFAVEKVVTAVKSLRRTPVRN